MARSLASKNPCATLPTNLAPMAYLLCGDCKFTSVFARFIKPPAPSLNIDKKRWLVSFVVLSVHSASNTAGEQQYDFARDVATFNRLELYTKTPCLAAHPRGWRVVIE